MRPLARLILVLLPALWPASPARATITTFQSAEDVEIDNLQTTTDCGDTAGSAVTATIGRVGGKATTNHRYLVHFDLTSIPAGATINSATLAVWVEAYTAEAITQFPIEVLRLINPDWEQATAK
jgi:hypothetical protein